MPQAMKVEPRFLTGDGPEIFTGNELLLKGALETPGGVHLLGGYPGSPVAGFFDALALVKELLKAKGIRAVINNNEALASAMLNGSQVAGCRGMIVIKSVGAHVAADALALGNLAGAHPEGGAVVVYGDDPWSDSTQVAADSRYISKHLYMPVIEPAEPQEVKDFVALAFELSRSAELYAGYVLTTNLADGGGSVQCRPNQFPPLNTWTRKALETAAIDVNKFVLLPPKTWWQEESLSGRFQRAVAASRRLGLNRILYPARRRKPVGFASSGLAHAYLVQALLDLGVLGDYPILKLGMSYPMDAEQVRRLAQQCQRIVVVEERRGFLEEQLSEVILQARQEGHPAGQAEVWGKQFPAGLAGLPATRGLHPSIVIEHLVELLKQLHGRRGRGGASGKYRKWQQELDTIESTAGVDVGKLPQRLPTFCPGCPHRDTADLCLEIKKRFMDGEYMQAAHGCGPVDLMFHGDTGCYTMLMYPPNEVLMHDYSGMGLGGGTGSGTDPFITNQQVVFMGDSTFFHSGQIAISQAIKLGQDITFIILDNRTTAMTGHQPTPGVDYDILGGPTPAQSIDEIIRGMDAYGQMQVVRVNVERRREYRRLLEKTFLAEGVKVVIADKECGITRLRRKRREERAITRRRGFLPDWEHMNINPELCRFCLTCVELTGCPGLKHVQTPYGRKMDTDLTWCINDGACERVLIKRKRPPRSRVPELGLEDIPEPEKRPPGELWRCCLVGFGGMGIGLATSILVRAGHKEGYQVLFVDKKGLAIRNGGVISQVVYNLGRKPVSAVIPYGKADLLIGIDVLEAARALDPAARMRVASRQRTAAVINTDKIATIHGLMAREDFDPAGLEAVIREHTRSDDYLARNISRICEKYLGSKLYANMMMLGFAFQKGLIPVSMRSIAWAIRDTIRAEVRKNLYAFNMGRKLVVQPDLFQGAPQRTGWREVLDEKCRCTIRRHRRGQRLADELRQLAAETVNTTADLPEPLKEAIVVRLYDCMRWGGMGYARRYARHVRDVYENDGAAQGFAATRAVIHTLANAMLIQDAIFAAELSTSPEKYARDREKYNVNPANGDRIVYRHLWHWAPAIGPWAASFDLKVYHWMLKLLRHARFLRKLLPFWHRQERQFLAEYEQDLAAFAPATDQQYQQALPALSSPPCMNCFNPRCQELGCPLAAQIPKWVELAYRQRWQEAAEKLHEDNNFPEITARVCPAPCQDQCKQGINDYPVQVRDIEGRIVERAFREGWVRPVRPERKTGRKVAVVGSGPAGLAAAQQLARAGHDVTVFEKDDRPGGLLRYGIPDFRLDKALIDRRLEQLTAEGVSFQTGVEVGKDIPAGQLKERFDAILLAVGARRPRDLKLPGRRRKGVHFALEFLRQQNLRQAGVETGRAQAINAAGKVVAVIGGGLTGEACVETALAQGAKQVHQLEILPEGSPQLPSVDNQTSAAAVHRQYGVATKAFNGQKPPAAGGSISEIQAVRVRWANSSNGPVMKELPGTEFRIRADLALLALGFDPVLDGELTEQLGLGVDHNGKPVVSDYATSVAGVFAAGDLVTGPAYVATAIDSGRKAAEKINQYLGEAATPAAAPA